MNSDDDFFMDKADDPITSIGEVIVGFQELEEALIVILACIIDSYNYALVIGHAMPFRKLVETIERLLMIPNAYSKNLGAFVEIRKELTQIEDRRNTFVHSHYNLYSWTPEKKKYIRSKIGKGHLFNSEVVDSRKVFIALCQQMADVLDKLWKLDFGDHEWMNT